jgi:hypothetical protein
MAPPTPGAPWTVILNGVAVLLGAAWFTTKLPAVRRNIRPTYRELGILPPGSALQ